MFKDMYEGIKAWTYVAISENVTDSILEGIPEGIPDENSEKI